MDEMTMGEWMCYGQGIGKRLKIMAKVAVGEQWEVKFNVYLGTMAWTALTGLSVADGEGNLQPLKKSEMWCFSKIVLNSLVGMD